MAIRRSGPALSCKSQRTDQARPRFRMPIIPAMIGTLLLVNIASVVFVLME